MLIGTFSFSNITDLTTITFLQVELWSVRSLRGDSLIGMTQVPLSNSYVNATTVTLSLSPIGKEATSAEIDVKLKLDPAVSNIHCIITLILKKNEI